MFLYSTFIIYIMYMHRFGSSAVPSLLPHLLKKSKISVNTAEKQNRIIQSLIHHPVLLPVHAVFIRNFRACVWSLVNRRAGLLMELAVGCVRALHPGDVVVDCLSLALHDITTREFH